MKSKPHPTNNQTTHYVSERQKRKKLRAPASMQPPLTPMIDVVFQLLLFFLLGCRFVQQEAQLRANLPPITDRPDRILVQPIRIELWPDTGSPSGVMMEMGGNQYTGMVALYTDLVDYREKLPPDKKDVPVVIDPKQGVKWQFVVDAFKQATRAQYATVGFAMR